MQSSDWNAIAPFWADLELYGLAPRSLRSVKSHFGQDVLVVGAGHGVLAEELKAWGRQVTSVDCSPEMARQAQRRRALNVIVADGQELPFRSKSFSTVLITTGVLESSGGHRISVLRESRRVLRDGGSLVLGANQPTEQMKSLGREFGYIDGCRVSHKKTVELWRAGHTREAWAKLCASWTRRTFAEASVITGKWFRHIAQLVHNVEHLAKKLEKSGVSSQGFFRTHSVFERPFFDNDHSILQMFKEVGLTASSWQRVDAQHCVTTAIRVK